MFNMSNTETGACEFIEAVHMAWYSYSSSGLTTARMNSSDSTNSTHSQTGPGVMSTWTPSMDFTQCLPPLPP